MFEKKQKRNFVVMDGSDKNFVKEVIGVVEMTTGNTHWFDKLKRNIRCKRLDKSHPTMKVITVKSHYRDFDAARKILTNVYPEQCVFDVQL